MARRVRASGGPHGTGLRNLRRRAAGRPGAVQRQLRGPRIPAGLGRIDRIPHPHRGSHARDLRPDRRSARPLRRVWAGCSSRWAGIRPHRSRIDQCCDPADLCGGETRSDERLDRTFPSGPAEHWNQSAAGTIASLDRWSRVAARHHNGCTVEAPPDRLAAPWHATQRRRKVGLMAVRMSVWAACAASSRIQRLASTADSRTSRREPASDSRIGPDPARSGRSLPSNRGGRIPGVRAGSRPSVTWSVSNLDCLSNPSG